MFFGSNGVIGFHSEALTPGPTVVVRHKGTVGAVYYGPRPCGLCSSLRSVVKID